MVKKNPVSARNPYKIMYKGTTHNKKSDRMHRPEGAGNFDNMDDYNIVKTVNCSELNCSDTLTITAGMPTIVFDDTHMGHDKYRIRIDDDELCFGAGSPNVDIMCLDSGDNSLSTAKTKITVTGGIAILLTNKTGANTIQGQIVKADTATDDAVILASAADDEAFGVFLEAGIADGSEAWVVVSGIADVAFDDNVAAVRGNWVATGVLAGYARTQAAPPALGVAAHFEEIGHCIQSVSAGGAGTHILARCVLHFN